MVDIRDVTFSKLPLQLQWGATKCTPPPGTLSNTSLDFGGVHFRYWRRVMRYVAYWGVTYFTNIGGYTSNTSLKKNGGVHFGLGGYTL